MKTEPDFTTLQKMLGHILTNDGPERDAAIAAFMRKLTASKIEYSDLRLSQFGGAEEALARFKEWQRKHQEAFERAREREAAAEVAEARAKEAEKRAKAARAKAKQSDPFPDPDRFTADDFLRFDTALLARMKDDELFAFGKDLANAVRVNAGNRTLKHDLPFGAIVIEALNRLKTMTFPGGKKPAAKDFLKETFNCSPQWAYRCRAAWEIVKGNEWPDILAEYRSNTKITVDEIVRWHRKWTKGIADPTPNQRTVRQKYNDLRSFIERAESLEAVKAYCRTLE